MLPGFAITRTAEQRSFDSNSFGGLIYTIRVALRMHQLNEEFIEDVWAYNTSN